MYNYVLKGFHGPMFGCHGHSTRIAGSIIDAMLSGQWLDNCLFAHYELRTLLL